MLFLKHADISDLTFYDKEAKVNIGMNLLESVYFAGLVETGRILFIWLNFLLL